MLGFYLDSQLTIPAAAPAGKKFLVPLKGGTKTSTVYLGDPYSTVLSSAASASDTTLSLDDVSEFLPAGKAAVGTQTVTYTGISGNQLTGVSGLTSAVTLGTVVKPLKQWLAEQPVVLYTSGGDKKTLGIAMRVTGSPSFNFPGMPLILISPVISTTVAIDLEITVPAGGYQEFTDWNISTSVLYARTTGNTSAPAANDTGLIASLQGYVLRRDQGLPQILRVLPLNRQVSDSQPGFMWGSYRWRNQDQINAHAILPSNWSIDPKSIGQEKFIAGIGAKNDLEPVGIIQEDDSIYLQVKRGHYYTGVNRYFLPSQPQLDFLPADQTTLNLTKKPTQTYPIFVGTYQLDSQGYYETATEYRYQTAAAVARGTDLPDIYYTLNRANNTIALSEPMTTKDIFIGAISGQPTDYFNIPVYPVGRVLQVYVQATTGAAPQVASNWSYDEDLGLITINAPSGSGPSVPGTFQGMAVFATCTPALAVLYETAAIEQDTLTVDSVDLNPAFAGLASGYVYLEQNRQEAQSLVLSCDKPLIPIPATLASIIGLVAYGPVYFNGDYALLQVKAYSGVPNQIVSNVRLQVVVDPGTFTGLINYQDPLTNPIEVVTGADGIANLIFTPKANYGVYIPVTAASGSLAGLAKTTIANDTLVLPGPVPISQIWNSSDGWLIKLYLVLNNNPLFGKVGANPSAGEIVYATTGTPGTASFKSNGYLQPWLNFNNFLSPIDARDAGGNSYTSPSFNGNVTSLVYATNIPNSTPTAAVFLTYLQRTIIRVQEIGTDVFSNRIMLQMAMPPVIDDSVFLILNDSAHGILNQYRLGIPASTS